MTDATPRVETLPKAERPNTVAGLFAKRAELLKLRDQLQTELRAVTCDLDHLDACITLFDPDKTPAARKRYLTKHRARAGQMKKFVLTALRKAAKPLTAREIAQMWCEERGLIADDGTLVTIRKRVGACLTALRDKGFAANAGYDATWLLWMKTSPSPPSPQDENLHRQIQVLNCKPPNE